MSRSRTPTPTDFPGDDAPAVFWRMVYTRSVADRVALAVEFLQIRQDEEDANWIGAQGNLQEHLAAANRRQLETARQAKAKAAATPKSRALKIAAELKAKNPTLSDRDIARRLAKKLRRPEGTIRGWLSGR